MLDPVTSKEVNAENGEVFVRRAPIVYIVYALTVLAIFWKAFYLAADRSTFQDLFVKVILLPASMIPWVRIATIPNCMVLSGTSLTIYGDLFTKESFNIDQLARIEIATSPFSKSFFVLDNYLRYEFSYFRVENDSFKKLLEVLGKPVIDI